MTSYAKQLVAAGYRKVKVPDLTAGMVASYHAAGVTSDRVVASVSPGRSGLKQVQFTDGVVVTCGNASKFWCKG